MSVTSSEGRLEVPAVYEFEEIESRWDGAWDGERTVEISGEADAGQPTYCVVCSPADRGGQAQFDCLRSDSFAATLAHYHRLRGRRVPVRLLHSTNGVAGPDGSERLRRDMLGRCDAGEVILRAERPGSGAVAGPRRSPRCGRRRFQRASPICASGRSG